MCRVCIQWQCIFLFFEWFRAHTDRDAQPQAPYPSSWIPVIALLGKSIPQCLNLQVGDVGCFVFMCDAVMLCVMLGDAVMQPNVLENVFEL